MTPNSEHGELVEALRAIGEEEMYQAPATTKRRIDEAADLIESLSLRMREPTAEMVEAGIRELNTTDMVYRDSQRARDASVVQRVFAAMARAALNR